MITLFSRLGYQGELGDSKTSRKKIIEGSVKKVKKKEKCIYRENGQKIIKTDQKWRRR